MKMSKLKRIVSIILVGVLMLNCTAYAIGPDYSVESDIEKEQAIQKAIQEEMDDVMAVVYEQLEAQGALNHLSLYEEILLPQVEFKVRAEQSDEAIESLLTERVGSLYFYFTFGGTGYYKTKNGDEVAITCMDYDNSYYYVLTQQLIKPSDVIKACLGYVPVIGWVFSTLVNIESVVTSAAYESIIAAKGYAMTIATKHNYDGSTSSVLIGWNDYPAYFLPDGTSNRQSFGFQHHNPWE